MEGGSITDNSVSRFSGGVYVVLGVFTMSGGSITGNTAGITSDDVGVTNYSGDPIFNLSGNAQIGNLALYARSTTNKNKITLAGNFTGSVAKLDLAGHNNTLAGSKGFWTGSTIPVVEAGAGISYVQMKDALTKFNLQNFMNDVGTFREAITPGYHLYGTQEGETDPAKMGTLVAD
jgi:hypothetical protein